MPFIRKIIKTDNSIKLFLLLMRRLGIRQSQAQKMIDTGKIFVDGKVVRDKAAVVRGEVEVLDFIPESRGIAPVFEARDFAIFDKPSGVMVHPRNRQSGYTLVDEARYRFGIDANITHRIDMETSGLVLVSKHKEAEKYLKGLFEAKKVHKRYLALVRGRLEKELFIDAPIRKNRDYSTVKLKVLVGDGGKSAQTIVRPLEVFGDMTLVEAVPLTGRQHQIRAHLFHVKHPIVGDPIYGVSTEIAIRYLDRELSHKERLRYTGAQRLMLHANLLEFPYKESHYRIVSRYDFAAECALVAAMSGF